MSYALQNDQNGHYFKQRYNGYTWEEIPHDGMKFVEKKKAQDFCEWVSKTFSTCTVKKV